MLRDWADLRSLNLTTPVGEEGAAGSESNEAEVPPWDKESVLFTEDRLGDNDGDAVDAGGVAVDESGVAVDEGSVAVDEGRTPAGAGSVEVGEDISGVDDDKAEVSEGSSEVDDGGGDVDDGGTVELEAKVSAAAT